MKKHNDKITILLLFALFLPSVLLAQEPLLFVVENETTASSNDDGPRLTIVLNAGDIVTSDGRINFGGKDMRMVDYESHILIGFRQNDKRYYAFAKDFSPLNIEDFFGEDIFIDYPIDRPVPNFINTTGDRPAAIADAMWVPHFYADILRGQDRNMLIEIQPRLEIMDDDGNPWYMNSVVNLMHGRAMFYNSAIVLGNETRLAVRNIRRTDFGYRVDGIVSRSDWRDFSGALLAGSAFWETYNPGDAVTLLLHLDGDYLDIYTQGTDIHVGTFIRVGREFQTQYQSLIRYNTSDLTNVVWSARADGTRHFEPPVIEAEPPPEVAETPVITPVEVATIEAPPVAAEENAQNAPVTGALPLWVWLAIGGGAIAVVGGVFVVARRKRVGVVE